MRTIKVCEWCGDSFESFHPKRDRFCQKACNNAWWADYRKKMSTIVPIELQPKVQQMVNDWLASPDCVIKHISKTLKAKLHKQYSCSEAVDTASESIELTKAFQLPKMWTCPKCESNWVENIRACPICSEAPGVELKEDSVD